MRHATAFHIGSLMGSLTVLKENGKLRMLPQAPITTQYDTNPMNPENHIVNNIRLVHQPGIVNFPPHED
jgi:hypothetical protein